jgi:hypothetical protein
MITFHELFSLPVRSKLSGFHCEKTSNWKKKKRTPLKQQGTSAFSHLNILFIPHIEMASHLSMSPRTAGIYNSIKAHESID